VDLAVSTAIIKTEAPGGTANTLETEISSPIRSKPSCSTTDVSSFARKSGISQNTGTMAKHLAPLHAMNDQWVASTATKDAVYVAVEAVQASVGY
jgi:hypothetical protein